MLHFQLLTISRRIYADLPKTLQRRFWYVMFVSVLTAGMEFVLAAAVSLLGVVLASPQSLVQSAAMQKLLLWLPALQPVAKDARLLLALLLVLVCAASLCKTVLMVFLTWRQSRFSQAVSMDFGIRLYRGYLAAPYLWHANQMISRLMTVLNWRFTLGLFLFNGLQVLSQLVVTGVLVAAVCLMAPLASLMILGVTGGSALLILRFSRKWVHAFGQQCADAQKTSTKMIHTALNGIREVMIYQQQAGFVRNFSQAEARYAHGQSILPIFPPLPSWVLEFVGILLLLATVLLLYWQDTSLTRMSATLALLAAVAWRLLPIMNRVLQSLIAMQAQIPMLEPVVEMLREVESIARPFVENPPTCPLREELRLRDVSFRYPTAEAQQGDALRRIDLRIPKGGMIGLIGPSGSGKSTLVGLLTGLYSPTAGDILVDGRSLNGEQLAGWMRGVGYVPQSPFLLNGSILENVAFSQWGAEPDRAHALRCCRMAAMNFLDDLPDGLDTEIGERGMRLSGGQVQRVAIARALYSNPQLLLFDEATSALDGAAEQAIQHTINSLSGQVTMIVVAHRLTTVEKCDFIYWIDKGNIRMAGRPDEILPVYSRYLEQSVNELIAPSS